MQPPRHEAVDAQRFRLGIAGVQLSAIALEVSVLELLTGQALTSRWLWAVVAAAAAVPAGCAWIIHRGHNLRWRDPDLLTVQMGAYYTFQLALLLWAPRLWAVLAVFTLASVHALALAGLYRMVLKRREPRAQRRADLTDAEAVPEVSDTFLQGIQGLLLRLHSAVEQLPDGHAVRTRIESTLTRADALMREGHAQVDQWRDDWEQLSLHDALAAAGDSMAAARDADFEMQLHGRPRRLVPPVREEAYRVGSIALRAAFEEARADQVEARVSYSDEALRVCVVDNRGLSGQQLEAVGPARPMAWPAMQLHAARVGGGVTLTSSPQGGSRIELAIPACSAYAESHPSHAATLRAR